MTTISQNRVVTHALFALVVLSTVSVVAKGIAVPAAPATAAASPPAASLAELPWPADVERDARLAPGVAPQAAESLHAAIRSTAYTCDRVSGARPNALTGGFTVDCNHNAFSYEVWNRDGEWTAEPQR
jgi:hypothetical protein